MVPISIIAGFSLKSAAGEAVFYPDGRSDAVEVSVCAKSGGYKIASKGFGSPVDIMEIKSEQ